MRRIPCCLAAGFALCSLLCVSGCAQQPTFRDALLDHLAGNWVLKGTIAGKETTHDVTAEWVLNHQYLRIHEVSREMQDRHPVEARVFVGWDQAIKQYACVWLDSYGGISPVSFANAKRSGDEIPFIFRDKDGDTHTTFRYIAQSNSWEWRIDQGQKEDLKPFARVKLTKRN
jgi:hypothetical protein